MNSVTPLLLAGGYGKRLWPLSRKSFPKQFTKLNSSQSLYQQSALRFLSSDILHFNDPITMTASDFRFIVRDQLLSVGVHPGLILLEPEIKNTAPSILAGTISAFKNDQNAIVVVAPSDHVIKDLKYFNELVRLGLKSVQKGDFVLFGIYPTHVETGYGYIQVKSINKLLPSKVVNFIEKPDTKTAARMIDEGNYLWNSGIFMFRAEDMIAAFEMYEKDLIYSVSDALKFSKNDMGFIRLDPSLWQSLKNISIDYAIMEKAKNLVAIPYNSEWSDLGDWQSIWRETSHDESGVALSKNAHAIDCTNSLFRSEDKRQQIVGLGLKDIIAVAMPDAVLIANKNKSQNVKEIVDYLDLHKISQAELLPKDYRPWGWFEILSLGDGFQVKKLCIKPGEAISLQSHQHRSEHWVVVKGEAKVSINDDIKLLTKGQSIFVPKDCIHRIQNLITTDTIIIEVQIGNYLGEDDIIRYDDKYLRK